ncbi:MAG: glycosyltransferase family 39 protein, partial [Methanobacterium paludis]|nr:glycosyltransferase family 39 protein [Methanobacterium paludis]
MENKHFLNNNWDLIVVLVLYSLLTVIYFHYYQYTTGGDELSYINIAHEYAVGKWGDAINGYWSPLYSWLMTPFLLLGSTPLYAVYVSKIVSLIIGFFTIISINRLSRTFELSNVVKRALLFSLIPVISFFSLMYNTPDLLLVCVLVYYLTVIFDPEYSDKWFNGVLCGFLGALAYLTKSFAFPFFLAHFILFNLIYYFRGLNSQKKRNVLKNMVLGLFVFFVIGGLWTGTI